MRYDLESISSSSSSAEGLKQPPTELSFQEGQRHGGKLIFQVDDGNRIVEKLQQEYADQDPTSDNPVSLGTIDTNWTDGETEIGLMLSKLHYGSIEDESYEREKSVIIRQYDDVADGETDSSPITCRITISKRGPGLVYPDGNEYSGQPGLDGEHYEGTNFEVQHSYTVSAEEARTRAMELLDAVDVPVDTSTIEESIIKPRKKESGSEQYHRVKNKKVGDVIDVLKDTNQITPVEENPDGYTEPEYIELYRIGIDDVEDIGFDKELPIDGDCSFELGEVHLKVYRYKEYDKYGEDHPLYHPKVEIEAMDAYPEWAVPALREKLNEILNAHVTDYAGVTSDQLVADQYYDGRDQPKVTTESPPNYRQLLKEQFDNADLKESAREFIYRRETQTPKDILIVLSRPQQPSMQTYENLAEEIGYTKGTIRYWAKELEDCELCTIVSDVVDFVELNPQIEQYVRELLTVAKPAGDLERELLVRRRQRTFDRKLQRLIENRGDPDFSNPLDSICYRLAPETLPSITLQKHENRYCPNDFLDVAAPPP